MQLNREDAAATQMVARMDELFAIDAEARVQNLDHAARHALRQQQARPLLEQMRQQIERCQSSALPASALGKACRYTLTLWHKRSAFWNIPSWS